LIQVIAEAYQTKDFFYKDFATEPSGNMIYSTTSNNGNHIEKFGNYNIAVTVIDNRQIPPQEVVKSSLKLL
jgi:hypothetical protein